MKTIKLLRYVAAFAFVLLVVSSSAFGADLPQREVDEIVKGVENGDADAQLRLGLMYFIGQNVKKDYEQAAYWLKKSYGQGNVEAQFLLALMYADGYGIEKDRARAFKLMRPIAAKNPNSIKNFYSLEIDAMPIHSAEELVSFAQVLVGLAYSNGDGVQKDVSQAKYWLNKGEAIKLRSADVQLRLAISLFEKKIQTNNYYLDDDLVKALSLFKKSYEQGNVEAQFLLALSYWMQGNKNEECFKLMKPVAEKDPATIKKVHGLTGEDGSKPYSSAEEMVAFAQFVIGICYVDGAGTEKNLEQAEYWLKKSLEHSPEFVRESAPQVLESIRTEKTGKSIASTAGSQTSATQPTNSGTKFMLSDAEYKQMMKDPKFANADKALNEAWKNAQKSMSANAFNSLKQAQDRWISSGGKEWAKYLTDDDEWSKSKAEAYTIVTQARAKYIYLHSSGCSAASVTGDKVNVRRKPNTKGQIIFQVSRYLYDERERLIIDSNNPAIDSKGDRWYKVLYRYTYTPDSDAPSFYEKINGYINGRFITHELLTEADYGLIVVSTALEISG